MWTSARRVPGSVRRSRCAHGSHRRWPKHSTSPTVKRRPTSALRSMPRVIDVAAGLLGRAIELVERLGLDQRQVVAARVAVGERAAAVEVAVALEAAAGVRDGLARRASSAPRPRARARAPRPVPARAARARGRRPQRDVGGRDHVALADVLERLAAAERCHASPGGAPNATAPPPRRRAQHREPRPGPVERAGSGSAPARARAARASCARPSTARVVRRRRGHVVAYSRIAARQAATDPSGVSWTSSPRRP